LEIPEGSTDFIYDGKIIPIHIEQLNKKNAIK
jgi:hypothetical protein